MTMCAQPSRTAAASRWGGGAARDSRACHLAGLPCVLLLAVPVHAVSAQLCVFSMACRPFPMLHRAPCSSLRRPLSCWSAEPSSGCCRLRCRCGGVGEEWLVCRWRSLNGWLLYLLQLLPLCCSHCLAVQGLCAQRAAAHRQPVRAARGQALPDPGGEQGCSKCAFLLSLAGCWK